MTSDQDSELGEVTVATTTTWNLPRCIAWICCKFSFFVSFYNSLALRQRIVSMPKCGNARADTDKEHTTAIQTYNGGLASQYLPDMRPYQETYKAHEL